MEPKVSTEPVAIAPRFTDKTAIGTGGAGDLGRAVARMLSADVPAGIASGLLTSDHVPDDLLDDLIIDRFTQNQRR